MISLNKQHNLPLHFFTKYHQHSWLPHISHLFAWSHFIKAWRIVDKLIMMRQVTRLSSSFSSIHHIRGKPERVDSKNVKLRGVHIKSTTVDSPNLIFFPEAFDQAENWLNFFTNPANKIIDQRNVYILYPRNFGNSDHTDDFGWEEVANDVARFMYEKRISMATLGGHGLGAKVALAASCYHFDKVTGYFGINSTPMDQYYHESVTELRGYLNFLQGLNIKRGFNSISADLKQHILCPKWRALFQNALVKGDGGYGWSFNFNAVHHNLTRHTPSNLTNWTTNIGLYPGRALFAFAEHSRFVHLATNTLPMYKVCPRLFGFNEDIFSIQGDDNPQNHWVYEREDDLNPFATRISQFVRHYDGVHVLLKSRDEVGSHFIPDINNARIPKEDFASDRAPAHYYHNWRFNNVYQK